MSSGSLSCCSPAFCCCCCCCWWFMSAAAWASPAAGGPGCGPGGRAAASRGGGGGGATLRLRGARAGRERAAARGRLVRVGARCGRPAGERASGRAGAGDARACTRARALGGAAAEAALPQPDGERQCRPGRRTLGPLLPPRRLLLGTASPSAAPGRAGGGGGGGGTDGAALCAARRGAAAAAQPPDRGPALAAPSARMRRRGR